MVAGVVAATDGWRFPVWHGGFVLRCASDGRAARPRLPKLAGGPVLACEAQRRPAQRWSPHAVSAELAELGHKARAESICRGRYDRSGSSGLDPDSRELLPRRRRHRKPRSRCGRAERSVLGGYKPTADRPPSAEDRQEPATGRATWTRARTTAQR